MLLAFLVFSLSPAVGGSWPNPMEQTDHCAVKLLVHSWVHTLNNPRERVEVMWKQWDRMINDSPETYMFNFFD